MTKVEIIKYVRYWFDSNPRSVNPDKTSDTYCLYKGPNGERCAFALFVEDGVKLIENKTAHSLLELMGEGILKQEVRGHSSDFWNDLQSFHDSEDFWEATETGNILTTHGVREYEKLLRDYQD